VWEFCEAAAQEGHTVCVITNASEVEAGVRCTLNSDDRLYLEGVNSRINLILTTPVKKSDFIPYSNPYLSKLLGLGCEALSSGKFDLVVGWYLEPYCVVAAILADMYSLPLYIRTAGSDIGKLSRHSDLSNLYRVILRRAHAVFSGAVGSGTYQRLLELGVKPDHIVNLRESGLPRAFSRTLTPLPLDWQEAIKAELTSAEKNDAGLWWEYLKLNDISFFNPALLTIGIYGKVGRTKGLGNILRALAKLFDSSKVEVNLICVPCGKPDDLTGFFESAKNYRNGNRNLLVLPPLAPWRVPEFLRRCDIACVLEHDFPIETHSPRLPREILAAGVLLLISHEVAIKQLFFGNLVHLKNCAIVKNPSDIDELLSVLGGLLADPVAIKDIARHGRFLSETIEHFLEPGNSMLNALVDLQVERMAEDN